MKTTIAYEVFYFFLKVYTFEELLILNSLYSKYIVNITFNQLLNGVLHFGFTILFLKCAKVKTKMIPL